MIHASRLRRGLSAAPVLMCVAMFESGAPVRAQSIEQEVPVNADAGASTPARPTSSSLSKPKAGGRRRADASKTSSKPGCFPLVRVVDVENDERLANVAVSINGDAVGWTMAPDGSLCVEIYPHLLGEVRVSVYRPGYASEDRSISTSVFGETSISISLRPLDARNASEAPVGQSPAPDAAPPAEQPLRDSAEPVRVPALELDPADAASPWSVAAQSDRHASLSDRRG
jgi:hypothetical protein